MAENTTFRFLGGLLRNPKHIGAIAPSSEKLAMAMVEGLELHPGELIIELGPGTGAFTKQISKIIPEGASYLGIERDPKFVRLLQKRYPHLTFVNGNAENLCDLRNGYNSMKTRVIISGLPFSIQVGEVRDNIIDGIDKLMTHGAVFRTMQYLHAYPIPSATRFRRRMTEVFGDFHRSKVIIPNLPPAFVLTWKR